MSKRIVYKVTPKLSMLHENWFPREIFSECFEAEIHETLRISKAQMKKDTLIKTLSVLTHTHFFYKNHIFSPEPRDS